MVKSGQSRKRNSSASATDAPAAKHSSPDLHTPGPAVEFDFSGITASATPSIRKIIEKHQQQCSQIRNNVQNTCSENYVNMTESLEKNVKEAEAALRKIMAEKTKQFNKRREQYELLTKALAVEAKKKQIEKALAKERKEHEAFKERFTKASNSAQKAVLKACDGWKSIQGKTKRNLTAKLSR